MSGILIADGCPVIVIIGKRTLWARQFDHLYMADPLIGERADDGLQIANSDPHIDESLPSRYKVRDAVACSEVHK